MRNKKWLSALLALVMVFTAMGITAFAEETTETTEVTAENAVAMVGTTYYATIDEAVAAWTNGTTLTLLSNVTLPDVYKFKSTESRTLNLGTYTLTAANGKHAIEIECNGQPSATYGLIVNADPQNPGGITATGKSCIYYRKSGTTKDRVIIQINGGVFNGSYAVNVYSSNRGTNCPQVSINGGIFNGNVNIGHGKLLASGGTFNGWVNCTGDSTAYRQISGGTFKSWQFMTADASNKFWVGTSSANYNVGAYVDENNYLVVGGPVITEQDEKACGALVDTYGWSSYLKYSSAAANGLYYEDADEALAKNKSAKKIKLYGEASTDITVKSNLTLDLTSVNANYTGNIKLNSATSSFEVILPEGGEYNGTVTQYGSSNYLVPKEEIVDGKKVITYTQTSDPAEKGYNASLIRDNTRIAYEFSEALDAAIPGDTITLLDDVVCNIDTSSAAALLALEDAVTIDLNRKKLSPEDPELPTFVAGKTYIIKNGTIEGDVVVNGGDLVIENVSINGDFTVKAGTAKINSGSVTGSIAVIGEAALDITGGTFTEDPTAYVSDGYDVIRHSDYYAVANLSEEAKSISVEFEKTDNEDNTDNLEGKDTYNIVLKANAGDSINELASADLTFKFVGTPVTSGAMHYTIAPAEGMTLSQIGDRYMFNYDGVTKDEENGTSIVIGTLTIEGYGAYTFSAIEADTNIVNATTVNDNLVDYYIKKGDTDDNAATGGLVINTDTDTSDKLIGEIADGNIAVPTRTLTIEIDFPNGVEKNDAAYQQMWVSIVGGNVDKKIALGKDSVAEPTDGTVAFPANITVNDGYEIEIDLPYNTTYTVTVEGLGYRTARHSVTLTEAKTLKFWNNVKDNAETIEAGKSEMTKNFLAGEIVKDNKINVYDLSAVVSYFGQVDLNKAGETYNSNYAKYDLNRDGKIDSLDVAYVLVSWNE